MASIKRFFVYVLLSCNVIIFVHKKFFNDYQ